MTEEQKRLVEENHKLIYDYLWKKNLSIEEYYDLAAIGLCKAAITYDGNKAAFSTYAYRCMANEIGCHFRKYYADRHIPDELIGSLQHIVELGDNDVTVEDRIGDVIDVEEEAILNDALDKFYYRLTDRERLILSLHRSGYKQKEISKRVGIKQPQVSRIIDKLRNRYRRLFE